jgi:acetate kinase
MSILSVNAGSSSLKFALYPIDSEQVGRVEVSGNIEGLEPSGQPRMSWRVDGKSSTRQIDVAPHQDVFEVALQQLNALLHTEFAHLQVQAVSHRVVHGGERFVRSVRVDEQVLTQLSALNSLAPLHQPHNLEGIRAFTKAFGHVPQIACFDTAFHAGMSELELTFGIDHALTEQGVRRYGFHGLSYQYVSGVLAQQSQRAQGRVIMAHLGNGASLCAMQSLRSCATSMGFSALDGLIMGTRSGAIDPGVLLYLMERGQTHDQIQNLLYKQSGLLGVSGISADMRTLRQSKERRAQLAIDLFTHRVIREMGAMSACLQGLDVMVFTGGIGEHDAVLRQQVGHALAYLGVQVDEALNSAATGDAVMAIHTPASAVQVWVIPTDEGRVAASEALALLRSDIHPDLHADSH